MPSSSYYTVLFSKLLKGTLSPQETEILVSWLSSDELDINAAELILKQLKKTENHQELDPQIAASLEARLPKILEPEAKKSSTIVRSLQKHWLRYAAAVLLLIATGSYFLFSNRSSKNQSNDQDIAVRKDIAPGKDGAILTLADGRKMVLDNANDGLISVQSGSKVLLQNGKLVYDPESSAASQISYNTLSTPRGRQFKLVLPDGSEVWLNAASSIRYPTAFAGHERKVEISGEAYFEVTRNPSMPFKVQVNKSTEVEVLGTHFNINSYENESSINTTLLEGSVNVVCNNEKAKLKPGQQARIGASVPSSGNNNSQQQIRIVDGVDIEKVMAWKNGVFNCDGAKLEEVMRQLERWYDIDVVYEKNVPQIEFVGKMGRDLSLMNVLNGLQMSKVHFRLEGGKKLVIMP